jgi:signal transduction histidine kinase
MLDIVWNNILSNANKFSNPNGRISIKQTSYHKKVYVQSADTGCGISQETLNSLFDKFYQGDPSRSSEGNGYGMALVQRVGNLF